MLLKAQVAENSCHAASFFVGLFKMVFAFHFLFSAVATVSIMCTMNSIFMALNHFFTNFSFLFTFLTIASHALQYICLIPHITPTHTPHCYPDNTFPASSLGNTAPFIRSAYGVGALSSTYARAQHHLFLTICSSIFFPISHIAASLRALVLRVFCTTQLSLIATY